jgi:hypothetical protein
MSFGTWTGTSWNVRWINSGKMGNYYTGAFKLYHLRIGANGTDKSPLDLVLSTHLTRSEQLYAANLPFPFILISKFHSSSALSVPFVFCTTRRTAAHEAQGRTPSLCSVCSLTRSLARSSIFSLTHTVLTERERES